VNRVVFAKDTADAIVRVTSFLQLLILAVALALGVAATFQILTTIQLAIFARRREIEVMKLVGATNWFIRVPFMMEGMVHGFMGAGAAFAVVAVGRGFVMSAVRNNQLFAEFFVSWSAVLGTGALLFAVGVVIGALGSGTAVSRFLDV
jgi:cell division transport system permease protein